MGIYMNRQKIEIKIMNPLMGTAIPLPAYATTGAAAMDLRACLDQPLTVQPGETVLVPSGIAISIHDTRLVALLVPDETAAAEWAKKTGKDADFAALRTDPAFKEFLAAAVARVNGNLSVIERVRHFMIAEEPFSTDNGEMTPTLKVRRHVLKARYGERLEALYR